MSDKPVRPGEVELEFDPSDQAFGGVARIGVIHSPWKRGDCPRNLIEARQRGGHFAIELLPEYRPAQDGLETGDAIIVLYWMAGASRKLLIQSPGHRDGTVGSFAIRSPARPNPIAVAVVRILALGAGTGEIVIDAIDAYDGTPLIDIKPWKASIDIPAPIP